GLRGSDAGGVRREPAQSPFSAGTACPVVLTQAAPADEVLIPTRNRVTFVVSAFRLLIQRGQLVFPHGGRVAQTVVDLAKANLGFLKAVLGHIALAQRSDEEAVRRAVIRTAATRVIRVESNAAGGDGTGGGAVVGLDRGVDDQSSQR